MKKRAEVNRKEISTWIVPNGKVDEIHSQPADKYKSKVIGTIKGSKALLPFHKILNAYSKRGSVAVTVSIALLKTLKRSGVTKAVFSLKREEDGHLFARRIVLRERFFHLPKCKRQFTRGIPSRVVRIPIQDKEYDLFLKTRD